MGILSGPLSQRIRTFGRAVMDTAVMTYVEVSIRAEIERARTELRLGNLNECDRLLTSARKEAKDASAYSSLDAVLLSLSGQLARARGNTARQSELFAQAVARFEQLGDQRLTARDRGDFGIALSAVGDDKRARTELELATEVDSAPPEATRELAAVWMRQGKPAKAAPLIEHALLAMPADPELHRLQAEVLAARGNRPEATKMLKQAGLLYLQAGRPAEAVSALDKAIRSDKSPSTDFALRAEAHRLAGDLPAALEDFDRALAAAPRDAVVLAHRASALVAVGELARAATDVEQALELGPEELDVLLAAGELYARTGDRDRASGYSRRALRVDPTNPRALEVAVSLTRDAGDLAGAFDLARKAGLDGGGRPTLLRLRWQLALLNDNAPDALLVLEHLYEHGDADAGDTYKYASMLADDASFAASLEVIQRGRTRWPEHLQLALLQGEVLVNDGQRAAALDHVEGLLTEYPDHPSVLLLLAVAVVSEDQPWSDHTVATALQAAARSAELAPEWGEPWWIRAWVLHASGDYAGALAAVNEVLLRDAVHRDAQRLALRVHVARGDLAEAERWAGKLVDQSPRDGQSVVDLARVLAHGGRYSEALALLRGPGLVWSSSEAQADHLLLRAQVHRLLTNLDAARTDLNKAVTLDPERAALWLDRSVVARLRDDLPVAREYVDRAVDLAPNNVEARLEQARILWALGDPDAALARLDDIVASWPGDVRPHLLRTDLIALGEPDRALGQLAALAIADPDDSDIAKSKALLEIELGDYDQARETVEALASWQQDADLLAAHAESMRLSGHPSEAIADAVQALDVSPEHYESLASLGLARLDSGDAVGAVVDFRRAAKIFAQDPLAKARLGHACAQSDDYDEAVKLLDEAATMAPTSMWVLCRLADTLTEIGMFAEGAHLYQMAIDVSDAVADAYNGMGWCLANLDASHRAEARAAFERAVELDANLWSRSNLAEMMYLAGEQEEATDLYRVVQREATRRRRESSDYVGLAAWTAYRLGDFNAAARWLYESTSGQIVTGSDAFDLALVHVCAGRIKRGARAYEALIPPPDRHALRGRGLLLVARNDLQQACEANPELADNPDAQGVLKKMDDALAAMPPVPSIAMISSVLESANLEVS